MSNCFRTIFFEASHLSTVVVSIHTCTHTHPTHAYLTHTTHVQINLQLHSDPFTASFLRSPETSVGDGHVTIPL